MGWAIRADTHASHHHRLDLSTIASTTIVAALVKRAVDIFLYHQTGNGIVGEAQRVLGLGLGVDLDVGRYCHGKFECRKVHQLALETVRGAEVAVSFLVDAFLPGIACWAMVR